VDLEDDLGNETTGVSKNGHDKTGGSTNNDDTSIDNEITGVGTEDGTEAEINEGESTGVLS
jgi:hypothetical protein